MGKKMIVLDDCMQCPFWGKCKPSKALTKRQKLTLVLGQGVGKFILQGCPLQDAEEFEIVTDQEKL